MGLDNWRPQISETEQKKRKAFGDQARNKRIANGLSIAEMAAVLFISEDLVVRIENGKVSPDTHNLLAKFNQLEKRKTLIIS